MMIPRYTPSIDIPLFVKWFVAAVPEKHARERLARTLYSNPENCETRYLYAFMNARQCLHVYFHGLRASTCGGTVLLSAQLCPVVAHIVRFFGFSLRFVDVDRSYPTPSVEQFLEAMDNETVAVILSPMYGYFQESWAPLLQRLKGAKLILDFAQGLLLDEYLEPDLLKRADAIVYSFGLGKGVDTGGGLLCVKEPHDVSSYRGSGRMYYAGIAMKAALLRLLILMGGYRYFLKQFDAAVEAAKDIPWQAEEWIMTPPESIYALWEIFLKKYRTDIERTRKRAQELGMLSSVQEICQDHAVFFSPHALHLRQIIRFKERKTRDSVLRDLREWGVDCLEAGEPLPGEYLDSTYSANNFKNALAFRGEALRLPFLGRLADKQFIYLKQKIGEALDKHLLH